MKSYDTKCSVPLTEETSTDKTDFITAWPPVNVSSKSQDAKEKAEIHREYLVVQHNDLIQNERFTIDNPSLPLLEKKIILFLISNIKPDTKSFDYITLNIKDFAEVLGIPVESNGATYSRIKAALNSLLSHVLWLKYPDKEVSAHWLAKVKMKKRSGTVCVKFDEDLLPYLIGLYGNFTQFPLHSIIAMNSKYGVMLYEILRSYCYKGKQIIFDIDDLKERLDCQSYNSFTNFKMRVLEPAIKDINTFSELLVKVQYTKTGRRFTGVSFLVVDLMNKKQLSDEDAKKYDDEAKRRKYKVDQVINNSSFSIYDALQKKETL